MNKRAYKKYTEVYEDLVRYCRMALAAGCRILPGERELAVQLETSRMTLRKALEEARLNGVIRQENKHTEILMPKSSLRQCGRILFITTGFHHKPLLGAMNRLYVELKAEMEALDADFDLVLVNEFTELAELEEKCEHANIILLTVLPCGNEYGCDYLKTLEYRKTVIALTDPFLSDFCNYAALDNRAVGRLAGKALLAARCRRPVFINGSTYNIMFQKRYEGIREFMKEAGVSFPAYSFQTHPEHFQEIRRMELLDALAAGHDGAFIASDEGIDYITHDLFEQGLVPEQFKLVTLHGSGEALCCHQPIACVNHATSGVVAVLMEHLKKLSRNPDVPPLRRLIKPELYLSQTIGHIDVKQLEVL